MFNLTQNKITDQIALVDLIRDAVVVRDLKGRIQFWNRGAESLYGWSKGEAVGRNSHELLRTSFPCSLERIQRDLSERGHWEGELCQITQNLKAVIVSSRWVLCTEHGAQNSVREVSTDITAHRKIEEDLRHINLELARERHSAEETLHAVRESMAANLEQAEATRTVLIRRFRHDLTDHLGSIMGFLQLLEDGRHGEPDPRQKHCIDNINISVSSLLKIVERIADQTTVAKPTCVPEASKGPLPKRGLRSSPIND
jgi:PAS domain S-box-containing protein